MCGGNGRIGHGAMIAGVCELCGAEISPLRSSSVIERSGRRKMKTKLVAGLRWWEFSSADGNLGAGESHQDRLQDDVEDRDEEQVEDGGEHHATDDGGTD